MRRARVLTLVDSLGRGGFQRQVVSLHGRLSRRRFDLRVASLMDPSPLARELREMKVTVHELGLASDRELFRGAVRVRRLISTMGIDLVHTWGTLSGVIGRLGAAGKAPLVSTLADPEDAGRPGRSLDLLGLLDRLTARRLASRRLVTSQASRAHHARRGLEAELLAGCVDQQGLGARLARADRELARRGLGLGPHAVVYLSVGRFRQGGGQDLLLRGFRVALTEEPRLRLLLAGDGPELGEARALAEELDLQDGAVFLGEVADVATLYRASDVFVLPTMRDASSTALLEAMAAALPALVHQGREGAELATEATAVFVDMEREEEVARGLLAFERDPGLRRRLGEGGGRRAGAFDVSGTAETLASIYEALL